MIFASVWQKAIRDIIRQTQNGNTDKNLDKDFILNTYEALNKSARNGYGDQYYNNPIARKIRQNLIEFSAVKTYVQQTYLQDLKNKYSDDKDFEDKARKYLDLQNGQYLNVQQAWTTRSAQGARQYQDWQRDKGEYPCVKFRTAGDDRVRYEHQLLDNITLPPSDPFWAEYYPPNGWRCRCTAVQVLKTSYEKSDSAQAMELGKGAIKDRDNIFRMNPGKQAVIFPQKHPYYKVLGKEGKEVVKEIMVGANHYSPSNTEEKKIISPEENAEVAKKRADTLQFGRNEIIGKYKFVHEKFTAKFVANSFKENLYSGPSFEARREVLHNIKQYLSNVTDYSFEPNKKTEKKPNVVGYHCLIGVYRGSVEELVGRKILFKFEVNNSEGKNADAKFYFFNFLEK